MDHYEIKRNLSPCEKRIQESGNNKPKRFQKYSESTPLLEAHLGEHASANRGETQIDEKHGPVVVRAMQKGANLDRLDHGKVRDIPWQRLAAE